MKTFNLTVSYNGDAETWDEIRNDAENGKINNVFIGTKEFVSVVRCKDCMHFILGDGFCTLHESCVSSDAFCSYGKRIEA